MTKIQFGSGWAISERTTETLTVPVRDSLAGDLGPHHVRLLLPQLAGPCGQEAVPLRL